MLILLVALSGIANAAHAAPWWMHNKYFGTTWAIVATSISEFIYWVAAQWSTWIIAFQFYCTT